MIKKLISILLICSLFSAASPVFADDDHTPEPYSDNEFPQGMKDLRRFEIITLGAMPFVTIDTMLTYSTIRYAQHNFDSQYSPNIFDPSAYNSDEQVGLLLTSLAISIGIGLTDYFIQVAKRNKRKKISTSQDNIDPQFKFLPVSEDPEAEKLDIPETQTNKEQETEE